MQVCVGCLYVHHVHGMTTILGCNMCQKSHPQAVLLSARMHSTAP